jgi:hypothetical protein
MIPRSREMLRQFTTIARKHHPKLALGLPPSTIHNIAINKCTRAKRAKRTENFRPSLSQEGELYIKMRSYDLYL